MTFQCCGTTRRSFNDTLAGFPTFIKDCLETFTPFRCYSVIKKHNKLLESMFGCSSWTRTTALVNCLKYQRSYHGSHWCTWRGILLPTNEHPVALCPRCIHRLKVYEKPTEGWQMWLWSYRRSIPKSPDKKWHWELTGPWLILVTACEQSPSFTGNQPCACCRQRTAQSPPQFWANGLQALSHLSEFVHIYKHFFFFFCDSMR